MSVAFTILLMIYCHIVDDYYLQGWLASAKQKKWWGEKAPQKIYRYDYVWALLMHSFSWAFTIMLPVAFQMRFEIDVAFLIVFAFNLIIHAIVDDLKANKGKINLWLDQITHILQIAFTAIILL